MKDKLIITTTNPVQELQNIASRSKLPPDKLDFSLISFKSFYRFGQEAEWVPASEKELVNFEQNDLFIRTDLYFRQEYQIEIFIKKATPLNKAVEILINKNFTKIIAQIRTAQLAHHDKLALALLQMIYKKIILAGLPVGLRIFDFKKRLVELVEKIKHKDTHGAHSDLLVAKGVVPKHSVDERLEEVYLKKAEKLNLDQRRSGIIVVGEGELVLRHIKPRLGEHGRGLNMDLLDIVQPQELKLKFSVSNALRAENGEHSTEYFATRRGYVLQNADKYDLGNVLEFPSLEFKNVGILTFGRDSEININVRNTEELEEAINSGVDVECNELSVMGNIAENVSLVANKISITGTTHKQCELRAKEAYVKIHKGSFEGDEINVDLLESGRIKAKIARIKRSLGGVIEADKVYIEDLGNQNHITFYETAVLDRSQGKNNKFIVRAKVPQFRNEQEYERLDDELLKLELKMETSKKNINANKNTIEAMKIKITQLKAARMAVPAQYEKMISHFHLYLEQYHRFEALRKKIKHRQAELRRLMSESQAQLMNAKLINKTGSWGDMNELRFFLNVPKKEIFKIMESNEKFKNIAPTKKIVNAKEQIVLENEAEFDEEGLEWLSPSKE